MSLAQHAPHHAPQQRRALTPRAVTQLYAAAMCMAVRLYAYTGDGSLGSGCSIGEGEIGIVRDPHGELRRES